MAEPETETRELACELTQAELLQRGDSMAVSELRIEQLKLKRGEVSDKIKAERALRRKLAGIIDTGREERDVRCVWIGDFVHNVFSLVRQDTGEVIDTRAMTAADRQEEMGFVADDPPARRHVDAEPDELSARRGRVNA
jgi:hypothetical protein